MTEHNTLNLALAFLSGIVVSEVVEAARPVQLGLGLFTCIAWLWISEALHLSVTALLVPVLASLLGLLNVTQSVSEFANPIIFLFMGGFALAAALQKYEIDRKLAVRLLSTSRGHPLIAVLLLFLATAVLSMWISNTATIAMMLPLAIGLLASRDPRRESTLFIFVLLGLAYSANIGGIVTVIGSPPNAVAASAIGLTFTDWLAFGIPAFFLLFPLMVGVLILLFRPDFGERFEIGVDELLPDRRRLQVLIIFALTAFGWLLSAPIADALGIESGMDSLIAIGAIVLLIATGSLEFEDFVRKAQWGILILFGGGLTLSLVLTETGASVWLADRLIGLLPDGNPWLLLLIVSVFVIFLTELVSNTASAALTVPLFVTVAEGFGYASTQMAVMIALCASCAFMLPVATPPNAIVFGSGLVPQCQMMRTGLVLNILFAFTLATFFHLFVY